MKMKFYSMKLFSLKPRFLGFILTVQRPATNGVFNSEFELVLRTKVSIDLTKLFCTWKFTTF